MNYLVFCTFDLKSATYQDYQRAYAELETLGLNKVQVADAGEKIIIPTTSVMGLFSGSNANAVRDTIRDKISRIFKLCNFQSEIFIVVGGDWSWWGMTTS